MFKTKRLLSLFLAIVMIASMAVTCMVTTSAEGAEVWDGTTATAPTKGTGTEADPYEIANGENLAWLSAQVAGGADTTGKYYVQTADIDLGGNDFTAIGTTYCHKATQIAFKGNYDGKGYAIANANIFAYDIPGTINADTGVKTENWNHGSGNTQYPTGIFGVLINATVSNIVAKNIKSGKYTPTALETATPATSANVALMKSIFDTTLAGGIAGVAKGSTISGCIVDANCRVAANEAAGGIVGWALDTTVTKCVNNATVYADYFASGIIGDASQVVVSYCVNNGSINIVSMHQSGESIVAGVVAHTNNFYTGTMADISYCVNSAKASFSALLLRQRTSGKSLRVGGIIGFTYGSYVHSTTYCYNLMSTVTIKDARTDLSNPHSLGAILAQVGSKCLTMDNCYSVDTKVSVYSYNAEADDVWGTAVYENVGMNMTDANTANEYPLAGLTNARNGSNAGTATYINYTPVSDSDENAKTCAYGKTAAEIRAMAGYQAIMNIVDTGVVAPGANYVGCQNTIDNTDGFGIRFVATLDTLSYAEAGFIVSIKKGDNVIAENKVVKAEKVYKSLTGTVDGTTIAYTAEQFGGEYLMAFAINPIALEDGETITITVQPYTTETVGGAKSTGVAYDVTYDADGNLVSQCACSVED